MSDDIVTRLGEMMQGCENPDCLGCQVESEAADEIERLRKRIWIWRKLADDMVNCLDSSTEASDLLADYEQAVRGERPA